jgi:hypothetical protein
MWRRRLALRFRRDMDKRAYIHLALMRDSILTVLRVACIFFTLAAFWIGVGVYYSLCSFFCDDFGLSLRFCFVNRYSRVEFIIH